MTLTRHLLLVVLSALALPPVSSAQPRADDLRPAASVVHAAWSRHAVIYEVNVRQFTPEGTFVALQKHLPRLRALGVDILWVMPVQPIGLKNRKGVLGSPYSINDYTALNREYGSREDFVALVRTAHAQGMKVLLDWVANHTAFDHPWIARHKDWYVTRADGTIINARDGEGHDTDWTDVAELDYDRPALRTAMIEAMRWWLVNTGIDGFRCDVAGGVPLDFWVDARTTLRRTRPDLFMLAEGEGPALHTAFDMTYAWQEHHLLNEIAKGTRPASSLDGYLAHEDSLYPRDAYRMSFTSDHDENSWNGSEFERMGENHRAAFVVAATLPRSMPLLYTGQEVSMRKRLRFFEKDTVDWSGPSLAPFYRAIFELRHRERALANGASGGPASALRTTSPDRVYAFSRTRGRNTVLVAVNFADARIDASYDGLAQPGRYTDWFSKRSAVLAATGSLSIPAHGFRILVR